MSDKGKVSEVLIPIPVGRPEACDRRRFIAGASAVLAAVALSSRQAAAQDVQEVDLWYFPSGNPHSIQGLAPDGCEFLLVFDDGKFSEGNTTLISDWARHTPREVLAKNWGVPESALDGVYSVPAEGHYIF